MKSEGLALGAMNFPSKLLVKLNERKSNASFRQLLLPKAQQIDFCSNDYLGIVKRSLLPFTDPHLKQGSTGSRLLTGNYSLLEETEQKIASFHEAETALIFNSGYDANLGILAAIPQKGDTVLYDSLCHASIRDGIRLSFAHSFSFRHNDIEDLQRKLQRAKGTVYIVTESVFSMDGDVCPLHEIVQLSYQYNAYIILDEAHGIGVIGETGEGLSQHLKLHQDIFCRIYTFGKACGCHGAAVVGTWLLRDYLVNYCRSLIYSTALPETSVASIKDSYDTFPLLQQERRSLAVLTQQFSAFLNKSSSGLATPIQTFLIPGNEKVKEKARFLQEAGFDIRAILSPTVPEGTERLRIILHSFNTIKEVEALTAELVTG